MADSIGGEYKIGLDPVTLFRCHRPPLLSLSPVSSRSFLLPLNTLPCEVEIASSQANPTHIMARRSSLESAQSFEILSPPSGSQVSEFSSSDDEEIVWSISSLSLSDKALFSPRSEDYVVLSPPSVTSSYAADMRPFIEDDLISNPPIPSQPPTPQPHSPSRRSRKKRNCNAHAQQQPARGQASPNSLSKPSDKKAPTTPQPKSPKKRKGRSENPSPPKGKCQSLVVAPPTPQSPTKGLGARSVVDDFSERGDDNDTIYEGGGSELSPAVYDRAVNYINRYVVVPRAAVWVVERSSNVILIPFILLAFCPTLLTTRPPIWRCCKRS